MKGLECFINITSEEIPRESYTFIEADNIDATLIIDRSDVNYTVTTDDCTTSTTASLSTDFDNDLSDRLDFNEVLSVGTCTKELSFAGPDNTAGNGTIKFTMLAPNSKSLDWEVSEDKKSLRLEFFTGFKGSNSGAFCAENCTCFAQFSEI